LLSYERDCAEQREIDVQKAVIHRDESPSRRDRLWWFTHMMPIVRKPTAYAM